MEYIKSLRELIQNQVKGFITDVMRPDISDEVAAEERKNNGNSPLCKNPLDAAYYERREVLKGKQPKYKSSGSVDKTTKFVKSESDAPGIEENNNPNYPSNLIDSLNTPFEYIERIVLQDFSSVLGSCDDSYEKNYFKYLFKDLNGKAGISFEDGKSYGVRCIRMSDGSGSAVSDYTTVRYGDTVNVNSYSSNSSVIICELEGDDYLICDDDETSDDIVCELDTNTQSYKDLFIDSFTYTPFVDYSQYGEYNSPSNQSVTICEREGDDCLVCDDETSNKTSSDVVCDSDTTIDSNTYTSSRGSYDKGEKFRGIYADEFLTKYNSGQYDSNEDIDVSQFQVDKNRGKITKTLFKLNNLDEDIYQAKLAFRKAVKLNSSDGSEKNTQVYIHTFCEHLFTLFAKLSNIRMSHIFYGFKSPHTQWEGILALDTWYNMLYKEIDAKFQFEDDYLDRNPMSKLKIEGDSVQYFGKTIPLTETLANNNGLEIISSGPGVDEGYSLLWDNNLYDKFKENSLKIRDSRSDCVLPRGVLKKIYTIVNTDWLTEDKINEIIGYSSGDFDWFHQRGKVYFDSDKSNFTKYTNLHLGTAYDVMTPKEYYETTGDGKYNTYDSSDRITTYGKPPRNAYTRETNLPMYSTMLKRGVAALQDAFSVIKNEKIFNIFNSNTNTIEQYNGENARYYSQAQCAIVIERVFSRLYKYLQFKSTTSEYFQKHINIDSGYKYLTTDSILDSDNPNSNAYYDDDDTHGGNEVKYMNYVQKLGEYLISDGNKSAILNEDEKQVLSNAIDVLSRKYPDWKDKLWNLCPLLTESGQNEDELDETNVDEVVFSRSASSGMKCINVSYNLNSFVDCALPDMSKFQDNVSLNQDNKGRPYSVWYETNGEVKLDLSSISIKPSFSYKGNVFQYELVGYTTKNGSSECQFSPTDVITDASIASNGVLNLYAVWKSKYIVEFSSGGNKNVIGHMPAMVISGNSAKLIKCEYQYNGYQMPRFKYYESSLDSWKKPVPEDDQEQVSLCGFDSWEYSIGGSTIQVSDQGLISLPEQSKNTYPVIVLTAKWKVCWDTIGFWIGSEKYCDVLVDKTTNQLTYPSLSPILTDTEMMFVGWDRVDGEFLSGVDVANNVICESDGQTKIYCEPPDYIDMNLTPIICEGFEVSSYQTKVNAKIANVLDSRLTVTFKYLDDSGEVVSKYIYAVENQIIPMFHIHSKVKLAGENDTHVFRYWKLESGNLTSSLTVMSSLVLTAVYDVMAESELVEETAPSETPTFLPVEDQEPARLYKCCGNHICQFKDVEGNVHYYCNYTGISPKDDANGQLHVNCPVINAINRQSHEKNDFNTLTILEISDITTLITALFKVNIDIAHREYYLKEELPNDTDWWYGYSEYKKKTIKVEAQDQVVCDFDEDDQTGREVEVICGNQGEVICGNQGEVICGNTNGEVTCKDQLICEQETGCSSQDEMICDNTVLQQSEEELQWYSFEPTVEYKFSNFHASNQIENGKLICTKKSNYSPKSIVPVNRELQTDEGAIHYNELVYYYDYASMLKTVKSVNKNNPDLFGKLVDIGQELSDNQRYYSINPLCLYENSTVQSPVNVNDSVKHRLNPIDRSNRQVQTFTSIVKKYRPIIVPSVRDIFNDCVNDSSKYEVDVNNDYGIFGWCTIPSKTMVNMQYNEQSIVVPSSYDHYNRVGGSNFLQLDSDLHDIYRCSNESGQVISNIKDTWYYLYDKRDWTYFLYPMFGIKPNTNVYSYMLDSFNQEFRPKNSNHLNGVIFETLNPSGDQIGRNGQENFGDIVDTCEFLAKYHHNEKNLTILSEQYIGIISYDKLKQLTVETEGSDVGTFNSLYGSCYEGISESFRYSDGDWIDDYDKTGSYVDSNIHTARYKYNLGQSHAIDDQDDDSVWMYITMVNPIEDVEQVVELEDIMPFVFWWSNRGKENNGPTVDCYGRMSNAKLNYELDGYCYESPVEKPKSEDWISIDQNDTSDGLTSEQRWHAVQHTFGVDFSKPEYGGTIVTQDNSGNCFKGAYDPCCIGTEEKWKVHHTSNAFGTEQHLDPTEDKYNLPYQAHGEGTGTTKINPTLNVEVLNSINEHPMTWNLWNVVRHYVFITEFKNKHRTLGSDGSNWDELESKTKKIVKGIYRTFQQKKLSGNTRTTFGDIDGSSTNYGEVCQVNWTNSFIEVTSLLERNAREHSASLVLFTGNSTYSYDEVRHSANNFRITTLDGFDGDDDGMRPRKLDSLKYVSEKEYPEKKFPPSSFKISVYQGKKYSDMPTSYVIGDSMSYQQMLPEISVMMSKSLNLNEEYPSSENQLEDISQKWIRYVTTTMLSKQVIPVYTSMENMTASHHDISDSDLKGITFQIVPQLYWRYDWSYNDFMIHEVGKLQSKENNLGLTLYDMLGNVWEWVRDDWYEQIEQLDGKINPIVKNTDSNKKTIRGGAFDSFARESISSTREGVSSDSNMSNFASQANIGFRPSLTYTSERDMGSFVAGRDAVELFFLFDASASQNNNFTTMIEQSKEIIKKFAGDSNSKDICRVGSALFLGPTIKFMCSEVYAEHQDYWDEIVESCRGEYGTKYIEYPPETIVVDERWKLTLDRAKSKQQLDEVFANKFYEIKKEFQSSGGMYVPQMMSSRDGETTAGPSHNNTVNSSGGRVSYLHHKYTSYTYKTHPKTLYVHCGVPAWKDDDKNLHLGEAKNFPSKYPFFTYDLTNNGIRDFDFPFSNSKKGCLSNFWNGCEPSSFMVSKLLKDGYFYTYPYNYPLGYVFRGTDVPRLVFVFTNEYDNEYQRNTEGSNWQSYGLMPVLYGRNIGLAKYDVSEPYMYGEDSTGRRTHETFNPSDPNCLQVVKESDNIGKFIKSINLTTSWSSLLEPINNLKTYISSLGNLEFHNPSDFIGILSERNRQQISSNGINYISGGPLSSGLIAKETISGPLGQIFTDEWINAFLNSDFSQINIKYEVLYNGDIKFSNDGFLGYDVPKTLGFYQLRNTLLNVDDMYNVYYMVSDANAPTKIDEIPIQFDNEGTPKWKGSNDVVDVFDNGRGTELMKDLGYDVDVTNKTLKIRIGNDKLVEKDDIKEEITNQVLLSMYPSKDETLFGQLSEVKTGQGEYKNYSWSQMCRAYEAFWSSLNAEYWKDWRYDSYSLGYSIDEILETIFGLENPYTKSNIVWGYRQPFSEIAAGTESQYIVVSGNRWDWNKGGDTDDEKINAEKLQNYINTNLETYSDGSWEKIHICPYDEWYNKERGGLNYWNITGGVDLILLHTTLYEADGVKKVSVNDNTNKSNSYLKYIYSSESITYGYDQNDNESFLLNRDNGIRDIVTLSYRGGGSLKIITLKAEISDNWKKNGTITVGTLNVTNHFGSCVLRNLANLEGKYTPGPWRHVMQSLANDQTNSVYKYVFGSKSSQVNKAKFATVFDNLYSLLKKAEPTLLAYRFYSQIFQKMTNKDGNSVTDYDNSENRIVMKALPIFDINRISSTFNTSFGEGGNFSVGTKFQYTHAVVDLNPNVDEYENLPSDKFPISFATDIRVNDGEEYKTSKLVLQKVESISGANHDSFTMGSSSADYSEITNRMQLLYKDASSKTDGAETHQAYVTLTNGGSFQKNGYANEEAGDKSYKDEYGFYAKKLTESEHNAIYEGMVNKPTFNPQKVAYKYFKNKHFFIDPFALTIAQWCYIHKWNTENLARFGLAGLDPFSTSSDFNIKNAPQWDRLDEIQRSWWKYLSIWNKEKWTEVRRMNGVTSTTTDGDLIDSLSSDVGNYNPLEDTRPYYYASYDEVRGSNQLNLGKPTSVSSNANQYVYSSDFYDEFQLNTLTTTSVLGLLNKFTTFKTRKRIYQTDTTDGGDMLMIGKMEQYENSSLTTDDNTQWCTGVEAGLNFDLPTEAQWEYCCRAGAQFKNAFPDSNLGSIYDTQSPELDVIAWYKYKVKSSAPEPERFCSWRVSKMMFGIGKDQEQVCSVYETIPD